MWHIKKRLQACMWQQKGLCPFKSLRHLFVYAEQTKPSAAAMLMQGASGSQADCTESMAQGRGGTYTRVQTWWAGMPALM